MNFGYLIVVAEHEEIDYLNLAYALAMSIKITQKPGYDKVALVIDKKEKLNKLLSPWVFDEVIEWDQEKFWDGRSYMYELSPWESTVCLDADMLFLRDYSHWIDFFEQTCDLYIPSKVYTYRDELVTGDYYRKTFTFNELPNLYSMWTWFKKDKTTCRDFFDLAKTIIKNPNEFSNVFLAEWKPKVIGTDESFSLASKILDITGDISFPMSFPQIVHMKGMIQNWPWPSDIVTDHVGFYLNKDCELKIGNFRQDKIVHYVEKKLITKEIISLLEEKLWKK